MPRVRRRLALVAGIVVAVSVALVAGPVVDGRRWDAGRPTAIAQAVPDGDSLAPLGRRWD